MAVDGAAPRNQQPDFIRYYLQFPPVTRTLLSAIFVISICLQFNIISRYTLYTSFFGSFLRFFDAGWGFGFLIALMTLYQQSSQVEAFFSTADYSWMLLMTAAVIVTLSRLITPFGFFLPALQVAIAYRWARLHPTASVHVYVVNVPAPWYPWAFLALDFMISGPVQAAVSFTGMLGAHLHLFLTEEWPRQGGRRFDTPAWFRNLFPRAAGGPNAGMQTRPFGTVIPPSEPLQQQPQAGQGTSGSSSGVFGRGTGNFRGQGHRLG